MYDNENNIPSAAGLTVPLSFYAGHLPMGSRWRNRMYVIFVLYCNNHYNNPIMTWLFLVHQVRTRNSRERVRVWRLTKKVGAALYRNSVYVLPYSSERLEDFQWLAGQIRDAKGEASVFSAESGDAREDRILRSMFEQRSREEFASLRKRAGRLTSEVPQRGSPPPSRAVVRKLAKESSQLQAEFAALRKIDFFEDPGAGEVQSALNGLHELVTSLEPARQKPAKVILRSKRDFQRKTWSTREHMHIDRLCSAWLIRRFIDPKAKFVFAPESKLPDASVPFDVAGAEFSHHGDNCTFETLLRVFRLRDRALEEIAEIVHDIDLKDHKFNREEAPGIDVMVRSLASMHADDRKLVEAGSAMLDALYKHLGRRKAP